MREQFGRVVAAGALALMLLAVSAGPAAAHDDIWNPHPHPHSTGGSSGNTIWVSTGAVGGAKRGYNNCPWQRGWPGSSGITETRTLPSLLQFVLANFGWAFGDISDPTATVELVPTDEADLDGDGNIDDDFSVPFFTDETDYVIGETEGLSWLEDLVLNMVGTHDLGVFIPDPNAGADVDTLPPEALEGDRYQQSGFYPLVQRGNDPLTGDALWWDPWFVAIEDQTGSCPAGVIYSPRINNPGILFPDLQAYVTRLLPPAQPIIRPLDSQYGWAYVQVPTNFAVASASLTRPSAHAEVQYIDPAGNSSALWAEIEAVPTHLVFDPGDGSDRVVCHLSQMGYDPADAGPCSHIYLDSSNTAGGTFTATVSVLWIGLYTDSSGANRTVNIAPTSASFAIAVGEARPAT